MQVLLNQPLDMNLGLSFTCNYVVFKLIVYRNLFFFFDCATFGWSFNS